MEPGQRILKVHGNSHQIADCLTKIMTPQAAHREAPRWRSVCVLTLEAAMFLALRDTLNVDKFVFFMKY